MRDDRAHNSTLKRSKVWSRHPKKPKPMRKIAKKKWDRYERDRGWVWLVFRDWLRLEDWPTPEGPVPCPKCGREVPMEDIDLDHIKHREKFPELIKNPHNFQPICKSDNKQKYYDDHGEDPGKRDLDYRSESLKAYMELRILSDWDEVGPGAFYPDEKCGVWTKTASGLTAWP